MLVGFVDEQKNERQGSGVYNPRILIKNTLRGENKMGILTNSLTLLGRVGKYKECKYFEQTGGMLTTINLSVKTGEKWNNFFVDFFNPKTRPLGEEVGDKVKEGDLIQIKGRLIENKFTPNHLKGQVDEKGNPLTVSQIKIVAFDYKRVRYNEGLEEWEYAE